MHDIESVELLIKLKAEKLRVENWRAKESTRDAVKNEILDFLYNDEIGLPLGPYSEEEVSSKANEVYLHIFQQYDHAESLSRSGG